MSMLSSSYQTPAITRAKGHILKTYANLSGSDSENDCMAGQRIQGPWKQILEKVQRS
jgi:hypothetical protein